MYAVAEQAETVREQRLREAAEASLRRSARPAEDSTRPRVRRRPSLAGVALRRLAAH